MDGTVYFNGFYQINYEAHHLPNETQVLFQAWWSGDVFYGEEDTPNINKYTFDKPAIESWLRFYNEFHQHLHTCLIDVNNPSHFKIEQIRDRGNAYFNDLIIYNEIALYAILGVSIVGFGCLMCLSPEILYGK